MLFAYGRNQFEDGGVFEGGVAGIQARRVYYSRELQRNVDEKSMRNPKNKQKKCIKVVQKCYNSRTKAVKKYTKVAQMKDGK